MIITGEIIKSIREKLGLSQLELATVLDLSRELINKMESGLLPISKSSKILLESFIKEKGLESEFISHTDEVGEGGVKYENIKVIPSEETAINSFLRIIESQQKLLSDQHSTVNKQQETIHYLTTRNDQSDDRSKKALG